MGHLTTHVLDTALGRPAAGLAIELARLGADGGAKVLKRVVTNADGRTDAPLLEGAGLERGTYELRFQAGDYHRAGNAPMADPPFLEVVPIRFGIADPGAHYHVPLLLSPYGFTTYRGS